MKQKRTLAPEALHEAQHLGESFDTHRPRTSTDAAFAQAPAKVREMDPTGQNGLALLRKIESQSSN